MLLVSIHDVTPALGPDVFRLWQLCRDCGVTPALFVVPNWHGAWPIEQHSSFITWLRERADEGAEVVLHGERHDEVGLPRRARDSIRAIGRTAGEGEFLTLDAGTALTRMQRGVDRLRALGLEPLGFVPPAWLAGPDIYLVASGCGLRFTEDHRSIRLLPSARRLPSPVVRWSARTPIRAWGSVAVAAARYPLQRGSRWPRIALHPQDLQHTAVSRSHGRTLRRWLTRHRPAGYSDLIAIRPS
jgi:uncharacterized protein